MRCPKCGANVPDGKSKCPYCFSPLSDQPYRSFSVNQQNVVNNNEMVTPRKSSADIYEKNVSAVAIITHDVRDESGKIIGTSAGSGCLISKDGYVMTNTHVVYDEDTDSVPEYVNVTLDGHTYVGRVLKTYYPPKDHTSLEDLAIIKVDASFPNYLRLGDSGTVRNGDEVTAIGNALGLGINVTRGIVSDTNKLFYGEYFLASDVGINGGNSGGPLFNSRGEVIAVCVCSPAMDHEAMNFFIPINHAREILRNWGYKF